MALNVNRFLEKIGEKWEIGMIALEKHTMKLGFLGILPLHIREELYRLLLNRSGSLAELHLRVGRASSALIGGERVPLSTLVTEKEIGATLDSLIGGSLYAFRDSLSEGFISAAGGVRVGIAGEGRYEGGKLVGVSRITSLCFRIPSAESSFGTELCNAFYKASRGLLIYSPPGAGKTSALRALVKKLGSGRYPLEVALIDERGEFPIEDFSDARVDILRGYKKSDGLKIALRSLSPQVIMVDEIGSSDEAEAMLSYVNSGVKIVATAHAASYSELREKRNLEAFFALRVFDCFAGLSREKDKFFCEVMSEND